MALRWTHVEPFGALLDVDLRQPLDDSEIEELRDVYATEHLLIARGQDLTWDEQLRFTEYLGPILADQSGAEVISNDPQVGLFGDIRLELHSDLAFCAAPILAGVLYPLELGGTSATIFASGARAYRDLPADLRARVDGLEVLHVFPVDQSRRCRAGDGPPDNPSHVHPLVMHDPRSGDPFLYLGEMQADSIVGLDPEESELLLNELFVRMRAPGNVVNHTWALGDCVAWDNLAVQHGRNAVADVGIRTLRRTSCGTLGFLEQCPQFGFSEDTGTVMRADEPAAG